MAFTDEFLYELRAHNPIEEVVAGYVNLKRAGRMYKGLCPFHAEKTPSFTVYPDTASFFCFGCGAGGDVITFIKRIENLDYPEAVRFLADRAGLTVPEDSVRSGLADAKMRVREINRTAARFFCKKLQSPEGAAARGYAEKRGLTPEIIKKFGIGFAPDNWDSLYNYLAKSGFKNEDIEAADLVRKNKYGRFNDRFRNRLMFPIIDLQGNVVGFGGRDLSGQSSAKYVNTSDTIIYKKTKNLYGLNIAKNSANRSLILCEGYMDAISMHSAGFSNAVASCGTALTEEQVQLLSRYAESVIICYDADEAGQKAVKRAVPMLKKTGMDISVLVVEGAKDPDEYIKKNGGESFNILLKNAPSDTEYLLACQRNLVNMQSPEGRVKYLNAAIAVISKIENRIERDVYAGKLAQETGTDKNSLLEQINRNDRAVQKKQQHESFVNMSREVSGKNDKINTERAANLQAASAEDKLIAYLLKNPERCGQLSEQIPAEKFITSFNKRVYAHILNCHSQGKEVNLGCFADTFTPEEVGAVTSIAVSAENIKFCDTDVTQCVNVILSAGEALKMEKAEQYEPSEIQKYLAELAKKKKKQ